MTCELLYKFIAIAYSYDNASSRKITEVKGTVSREFCFNWDCGGLD